MSKQEQVGDRIRAVREARGWSQAKLAREANVSENTVLSAEKGKRATQGEKIRRILDALGMAALEDEAVLDLADVPGDARTFLRIAARRLAAMDEDVRTRVIAALYPSLIEEEPPEYRAIREAREAREAELAQKVPDTPDEERNATAKA